MPYLALVCLLELCSKSNFIISFLPEPVKNEPRTEEDAKDLTQVRIAFVFTVNGRAIRQIKRILRNLYDPRHFYIFHVDKVCSKLKDFNLTKLMMVIFLASRLPIP